MKVQKLSPVWVLRDVIPRAKVDQQPVFAAHHFPVFIKKVVCRDNSVPECNRTIAVSKVSILVTKLLVLYVFVIGDYVFFSRNFLGQTRDINTVNKHNVTLTH
jgi:hypothetical protein